MDSRDDGDSGSRLRDAAPEILGALRRKNFAVCLSWSFCSPPATRSPSQVKFFLGPVVRRIWSMALRNRSLAAVALMPQAAPTSGHFCPA